MDLREKKTKRSIQNAFLQLRAHTPLERITIKELSELAEISKATFYLHYRDIYDLSRQLQNDVIQNILDSLTAPELFLSSPSLFLQELFYAFCDNQNLIDILFSGTQASVLPIYLEQRLKEHVFSVLPDLKNDARINILLTYQIQGGYYAYLENHKQFGDERVMEILDEITPKFQYVPES